MVHTEEVPYEEWNGFVNLITRLAADRPVRLEVELRELGDQEMTTLLPLRAIELERKGSARGSLRVTVGSQRGELSHSIEHPIGVYFGHNDQAELEWVAIQEADGSKTWVHFPRLSLIEAGESRDMPNTM